MYDPVLALKSSHPTAHGTQRWFQNPPTLGIKVCACDVMITWFVTIILFLYFDICRSSQLLFFISQLDHAACKKIRHSAGQPDSQAVSLSTWQLGSEPVKLTVRQSASQPAKLTVRQSACQPDSLAVRQPDSQPSSQVARQLGSHIARQASHVANQPGTQTTWQPNSQANQLRCQPGSQVLVARQLDSLAARQLGKPGRQPSSQVPRQLSSQIARQASLVASQVAKQPNSQTDWQPESQASQLGSQPGSQAAKQLDSLAARQLGKPARQPSSQLASQPSIQASQPGSQQSFRKQVQTLHTLNLNSPKCCTRTQTPPYSTVLVYIRKMSLSAIYDKNLAYKYTVLYRYLQRWAYNYCSLDLTYSPRFIKKTQLWLTNCAILNYIRILYRFEYTSSLT